MDTGNLITILVVALVLVVVRAHRLGYAAKDRTEGMRQALLHYRVVMVRMMGSQQQASTEEKKRDMAYKR
ncbi:MAG TPA: hypothetical protein VJP81_07105 [Candidatus Dormibacteraeota bacterium]|nr:hypothetical protein [Candidatus Dormibacteraeota bacterium]